jgi:subtilisin family serine protease
VNALLVSLTPEQIARAAALPDVAYVYPSTEELPTRVDSAGVEKVLPRVTRRPFTWNGKRIPWNLRLLRAPESWRDLAVTGRGVRVAVLDFGFNYMHQDLRNAVWRNAGETPNNRVDDDRNGYVDDYYGYDFGAMQADVRLTTGTYQHGTVTAGLVAGDGSGGIITGIAPDAELMLLLGTGPTAATLAYQYAAEHDADIVSMSFSIPDLGSVRGYWRMLSDHAVASGLLLVGGAGNFRTSRQIPTQLWSPKDVPSVIAMAGVDSTLARSSFSSGGPVEWASVPFYADYPMPVGLRKPDLVAFPGPHYPILGGADSGYVDPNPLTAGNSLSGPQGAGVAALIFSAAPWMPVWRVRQIMESTAHDLGAVGPDNETGHGLLDAERAVREAQRQGRARSRS